MTLNSTIGTLPLRHSSLATPSVDHRGMTDVEEQLEKVKTHPGFIAALDQSGGSTPHTLIEYAITEETKMRSVIKQADNAGIGQIVTQQFELARQIGGEPDVVRHLDPIFARLAPGLGDIARTESTRTSCLLAAGTTRNLSQRRKRRCGH